MREYTVPTQVEVDPNANVADAVYENADLEPDRVVFSRKIDGKWTDVTAREFRDEVAALAKGFMAAGIEPGDRVGLMSRTRYEWTLADYAIWSAGAVPVPIYETSSPEQVAWILGDSGAKALITETSDHRKAYDEVASELPDIKNVWSIDAGSLADLSHSGTQVTDDDLTERRRTLKADSLATIIYTSGTTGRPKGCELTHENFIFDSAATTEGLGELFDSSNSTLLFLPLAHVFARLIQVGCIRTRVRFGHTNDIKNLLPDFAIFQPTFILSVPRIFEKVYTTAKNKAHSSGKGAIFDRAESIAVKYSEAMEDKGGPSLLLKVQHRLYDRLVYGKLRAALGGQVEYAVSGGAPLGARLGHFFRGVGITVLEGYGLTETSAGATLNLPDSIRIGTVGKPIPGVTVRIADDGEILLKGSNVFRGYWHNADATKEALENDGWFHTGDIGELDEDGFLKITGRKKELIVTAGGKNVSPAVLEDRLRAHPLISQCMVVGDNQPFIAALVTIDEEAFPAWKRDHAKPDDATVEDLREDEDLNKTVQEAVDEANKAVSHAESIRKFRILAVDFTEDGGHITPTLKLKRNVVAKDFADEIDALYTK
ncbi:MAG: long-chain acyl-CoA synthetase [Frankiales bacterium]|nr:long-chain acyl-CoA synthetase [Frankiales bacterium]